MRAIKTGLYNLDVNQFYTVDFDWWQWRFFNNASGEEMNKIYSLLSDYRDKDDDTLKYRDMRDGKEMRWEIARHWRSEHWDWLICRVAGYAEMMAVNLYPGVTDEELLDATEFINTKVIMTYMAGSRLISSNLLKDVNMFILPLPGMQKELTQELYMCLQSVYTKEMECGESEE